MYPNWHCGNGGDKAFAKMLTVKGINCLQIGVFTGDASLWLLDNLECTLTDVDIWEQCNYGHHDVEAEYDRRLQGRATKIKGDSQVVLPTLPKESYDFIYVDGLHTEEAVYNDAVKAWPLLKQGGLMSFDDYEWNQWKGTKNHPKKGIDKFVEEYKTELEVVYVAYQYWVKKV